MPPFAIVTVSESVLPAAVTVIAEVPSKFTPLMARCVARAVAVAALPVVDADDPLALPVIFAVIVPALKFPDASRATIADAVFAFVAVVALFGMLVKVFLIR